MKPVFQSRGHKLKAPFGFRKKCLSFVLMTKSFGRLQRHKTCDFAVGLKDHD